VTWTYVSLNLPALVLLAMLWATLVYGAMHRLVIPALRRLGRRL